MSTQRTPTEWRDTFQPSPSFSWHSSWTEVSKVTPIDQVMWNTGKVTVFRVWKIQALSLLALWLHPSYSLSSCVPPYLVSVRLQVVYACGTHNSEIIICKHCEFFISHSHLGKSTDLDHFPCDSEVRTGYLGKKSFCGWEGGGGLLGA